MKHINPKESKIKRCTLCSITLEIKEVNSLKGNCYISNYNNKIYKCNKCFSHSRSASMSKENRKASSVVRL